MRLEAIEAREILDSRGNPTLEVTMHSGQKFASFAVPGGASTGRREAKVLSSPDGSMQAALSTLNRLAPKLIGQRLAEPAAFDQIIQSADPSPTKEHLGGNTALGLSGAYWRLSAVVQQQPLWRWVADWAETQPAWPRLYANLINGGKHAPGLDIQEFLAVTPPDAPSRTIRQLRQIYHHLAASLTEQFGPTSRLVGDEGGFAPSGASHEQIWQTLRAVTSETSCGLAADAAATSLQRGDRYQFEGGLRDRGQLDQLYRQWIKNYDLVSLEDPFGEDDPAGFAELKAVAGDCLIVGDDLTTTQAPAIEQAAKADLISAVIIKPNQIGTMTETLAAVKTAQAHQLKVIVSHRSGETLDDSIADLAVGLGAYGFKLGAPARGERIAKYNRLLKIEEEMR